MLRGGIEMGTALEDGDEEVLGSGLAHAYKLECKIAKHPRIAIGPRVLAFLGQADSEEKLLELDCPKDHIGPVMRTAGLIQSMTCRDNDGVYRVDFTSDTAWAPDTGELIAVAISKLQETATSPPSALSAEARKKHRWLLDELIRSKR